MTTRSFPSRKISETFLDYASPLLDPLGLPTKEQMEQALKIAFTVWNSAVYDAVSGESHHLAQVRELAAVNPIVAALIESMIQRKQELFADDERLVGKFTFVKSEGEWRLRVEARDPRKTAK